MHIIARKYIEKRASQSDAMIDQLKSVYPYTNKIFGDPAMYGVYSRYTPDSQYLNAVAPSVAKDAVYGGLGGLGASLALTGMQGIGALKLPASLRHTATIGGAMLGGLAGLGLATTGYLTGKYLL